MSPKRTVAALASANIVAHLTALVASAICLRPGTPIHPIDERMAWIDAHVALWRIGWSAWMPCAVTFLALQVVLRRGGARQPLAWCAAAFALAAALLDLFCDIQWVTAIPALAHDRSRDLFELTEHWLRLGGLVGANGLYSVAVLAMTYALPPNRELRIAGWITFIAGLLLVVAGFTGVAWHAEAATGPTMIAFLLWCVAVSRVSR